MNAANVWSLVLDFFTGRMPYHYEMRAFAMALQGSLIVKNGPNKMGEMDPFHALALSTIFGFGGSWFTGMWLGKPTSMISNGDVNITLCLLAFGLVNYTPVSTLLNKILPLKMCMVSFAQLFRSLGMIAFITQAYNEVGASKYYPTPILGPVLYGALLGNMGGFFMKGFEGHLKNGVPWSFQNGVVVGLLFHLFVHDQEGFLGSFLRDQVHKVSNFFVAPEEDGTLVVFGQPIDDKTFAVFCTNLFVNISGILHMPEFLGPTFNPILSPIRWMGRTLKTTTRSTSEPKRKAA